MIFILYEDIKTIFDEIVRKVHWFRLTTVCNLSIFTVVHFGILNEWSRLFLFKILPDEENDTSFFSLSVKVPESKTTKEEGYIIINLTYSSLRLDKKNFIITYECTMHFITTKHLIWFFPWLLPYIESSLITGWHSLKLHYDVQWPLHVVFTPSFLEKYVYFHFIKYCFTFWKVSYKLSGHAYLFSRFWKAYLYKSFSTCESCV